MASRLTHASVAQLERIAARCELPGDADIIAHVAGCASCLDRKHEVTAARDAFLASNPPASRVGAIIALSRRGRDRVLAGALALAAAAATVAITIWLWPSPRSEPVALRDHVIAKGSDAPVVVATVVPGVGTALGSPRVTGNGSIARGDTVQFELDPKGRAWVGLYELGPGRIERLLALPHPATGPLPDAFSVDDDADHRLAFVFAVHPLTDAEAQAAIASGSRDAITFTFVQQTKPDRVPRPNVPPR